jgi:hypothetical protein
MSKRKPTKGLSANGSDGCERLVIVCDWLPPEFGAVGQYMLQRAESAARSGGDVTLIGLGRGETSLADLVMGSGRLRVLRVKAGVTPKHSLIRRGLWALGRNLHLLAEVAKAQKGPDNVEILVTGSPPFLSQMLVLANFAWRRPLTYRITDFYPETALASGHAPFLRRFLPVFQWVRRRVPTIEILGEDQGRRLIEGGVPASHLRLARDTTPIEIHPDTPAAERPYAPDDLVLLYSGNLGVAHDLTTFCEGYRRHIQDGSNRVRLWVNGLGVRVGELEAYCRRHDLPLAITPPVALSRLPGVLKAADAHLVLLGADYWGYVLPSKIYACLMAGQPILYVGPEESDVALLLGEAPGKGHAHALPGDPDRCFEALEALAARHAGRDDRDEDASRQAAARARC